MARVAFAWELGAGLGHVVPLWDLGTTLVQHDHEVGFILRDPEALRRLPGGAAFRVLPAPRFAGEGQEFQVPATYAEILLSCGFASADTLRAQVAGWIEGLRALAPDFVVEDYGPTALLAARILGIRRARCANGFAIPPRTVPLPPFRFDLDVPPSRIAESEARALDSVNAVLGAHGQAPLASLAEMLACDETFLCTLPELDHYGNRPPSGYWGPRVRFHVGREVAWPKGPGPCILAYLYDSPLIVPALEALSTRKCRLVAYIPGLLPEHRALLEGPGRVVSDEMVRIDKLLPGCDLVLNHGGGLTVGALLAGIPQFVLPQHYEQYITAKRVEQMGAGGWVGAEATRETAGRMFDLVLSQPRFRAAAQAFAARYRGFSPEEQRRRIVQRIEELLPA